MTFIDGTVVNVALPALQADLNVATDPRQRAAVQRSIEDAFVSGFRVAVLGSAILALAAAGFGAAIRDRRGAIHS